jgi:drug/metabolite transporter (DMT)-like permease
MAFGLNSAKLPLMALLFSSAFWGTSWYPLRWLELHGMPGLWVPLVGYLAGLPVLLLWHRFNPALVKQDGVWLLLLALSAGWASMAFILAMLNGIVMRVLLLFYLAPLWSVLLAWLLLGEQIRIRMVGALMMALLGAVAMVWVPDGEGVADFTPADWLALTAGMGFALNNVIVRKLAHVSVDEKLAATWVGVPLVAGLAILVMAQPVPEVPWSIYGVTALLGIAGFYLSALALFYGLARMTVQRSAIILMFELVAGGISAALLAGEVLSLLEGAGGLLIVLAGYLVVRWEVPE